LQVLKASAAIRREQLASEIAVLLKVHHPNIVQFLGASTQEELLMIVSEMMDGGSLETALQRRRKLPLRRVLEIALDCARGLNFLHLANPHCLIHRDLKPSNIMLAGCGAVSAVCLCYQRMHGHCGAMSETAQYSHSPVFTGNRTATGLSRVAHA
jgi:serine/threonine protein kinase